MLCAECNRAMTRNGDAYYGPHTPTHHVSLTVTYAIPGSAGRLQMVTTPSADWLVDGRPCSQAWRQCSTFVMFFHSLLFPVADLDIRSQGVHSRVTTLLSLGLRMTLFEAVKFTG
jgi:hypothetical protein